MRLTQPGRDRPATRSVHQSGRQAQPASQRRSRLRSGMEARLPVPSGPPFRRAPPAVAAGVPPSRLLHRDLSRAGPRGARPGRVLRGEDAAASAIASYTFPRALPSRSPAASVPVGIPSRCVASRPCCRVVFTGFKRFGPGPARLTSPGEPLAWRANRASSEGFWCLRGTGPALAITASGCPKPHNRRLCLRRCF